MEVVHWKDCEDKKVEKFPYRGQMNDVIGTSIRWLSQHGDDGNGYPDYGLRFFTIQPGARFRFTTTFTTKPCSLSPVSSSAGNSIPKQMN